MPDAPALNSLEMFRAFDLRTPTSMHADDRSPAGVGMTVSVVVPTRNEEQNIEPLVAGLRGTFGDRPFELVFVDDSSDSTPERIRDLVEAGAPLRLLHRPPHARHGGLGGAVLEGFAAADGEVIVVMDADLQHPPQLAAKLAATVALGMADIAVASRFAAGASARGLAGPVRHLVTAGTRRLAHVAVPRSRGIQDPLSGCFALRREVLSSGPRRSDGFKVLLDVLALGTWTTAVELPFVLGARTAGSSKAHATEGARFLRQCWRLRRCGAASVAA